MEERLQKILSRHGVASRRKAEELILARRVRVNGNTAQLGDTADELTDVIEVDGVRLKKATPDEIAEKVPGIGEALAEKILAALG